jgi:hypothetical protein
MFIVGLRGENKPKSSHDDVVDGDLNEVRLSVYFAGRWYEMSQRKHHRWKLSQAQIKQYGLEGQLSTSRDWFEHISIAQRRLTFLAPSGWLGLCPLICEDLAQFEPVSEVIRGVGPSLLLALLLDGPQIKGRWSARYASVFADDPGTAVLSLTAKGMANHARHKDDQRMTEPKLCQVALWKDQVTGWHSFQLNKSEDAFLITVAAQRVEEYTADNRTDHATAATLKFEGVRYYSSATLEKTWQGVPISVSYKRQNQENSPEDLFADWTDLREWSAFSFVLDAWLARHGKHCEQIFAWLTSEDVAPYLIRLTRLQPLVARVKSAQVKPHVAGISAASNRDWRTPSLLEAVEQLKRWSETKESDEKQYAYWISEACAMLNNLRVMKADRKTVSVTQTDTADSLVELEHPYRIRGTISWALLIALHHELSRLHTRRNTHGHVPSNSDKSIPLTTARTFLQRIEEELKQSW